MSENHTKSWKSSGLAHLWNAIRFSVQGLTSAFKNESAFRHELLAGVILLPTGIYYADGLGWAVALTSACLLVLSIELMNSGLEAVVDRIGTEEHPLSGQAKDYGSAAVMLSMFIVGVIWIAIMYQAVIG